MNSRFLEDVPQLCNNFLPHAQQFLLNVFLSIAEIISLSSPGWLEPTAECFRAMLRACLTTLLALVAADIDNVYPVPYVTNPVARHVAYAVPANTPTVCILLCFFLIPS